MSDFDPQYMLKPLNLVVGTGYSPGGVGVIAYSWGDHAQAGYQLVLDEGPFVDGDKQKLDGLDDSVILKSNVTALLTKGFNSTDYPVGVISNGTYLPNPANGNFQVVTNGGEHTISPPNTSCTVVVVYTNNINAGVITTSGFTQVTGDPFTLVDEDEFMCFITRCGGHSTLHVTALQ